MNYARIAEVVVGLPVDGPFDYLIEEGLAGRVSVGMRVCVHFGRHKMVGYVVGLKARSAVQKIKPVSSVLDNAPVLSETALKLTRKISKYYGASWGEAIEASLPAGLRKIRHFNLPRIADTSLSVFPKKGCKGGGGSYNLRKDGLLIQDIDGNSHWQFTFSCIAEALRNGRSVIFMVPEAVMVKEIYARFLEYREILGAQTVPIIIFDKKLSVKQELDLWAKAYSTISIVIGTRSAVFAPALNLGLIVVCDEDNFAYKQEQPPHYHCRHVAYMRAQLEGCKLFFLSAVPSLEAIEFARKARFKKKIFVSQKDVKVKVVDMTNYKPGRASMLSFPAQNYVSSALEKGEKVLLFMNRRGFSTVTSCSSCGHVLRCPRCRVNLIYLYSQKVLACTHCSFRGPLPKLCPECHGRYLHSFGRGIEKLESEAARLYAGAKTACLDKDSVDIDKDARIVIATQAVLKLRDRLRFGLVVMINFDDELNRFDFRSSYKAFSLMVHLRQMAEDTIIIQTRMKNNYCIRAFRKMSFNIFYREEKRLRSELTLPPFGHMVLVRLRGEDEGKVFDYGKQISSELIRRLSDAADGLEGKDKPTKIEVYGPYSDTTPKLRDKYRYVIMVKARPASMLMRFVKDTLKSVRKKKGIITSIDVDA